MISVVSAVRDLGRLREITTVLVRHGFGELVTRAGFGRKKASGSSAPAGSASLPPPSPSSAPGVAAAADGIAIVTDELTQEGERAKARNSRGERVRLVLQDLGPSFIKLGQIASTRPDLIPADVLAELKRLQDDVPAVPFADIKVAIESSLAATLTQCGPGWANHCLQWNLDRGLLVRRDDEIAVA